MNNATKIGIMLVAAFAIVFFFMNVNKVQVKIYKHIESGGIIYCQTGELTGDAHEYLGTGKIDEDKAVHC